MNLKDAIRLEIPPHFTHDYGNRWDRQKHMPFAAIGAAISGAVAGAFAAGAGAAVALGATAGGLAATAVGVVSAVGLVATYTGIALTVVGAVTGNTKLMKIGGMVGLAGGVTGLAVSAINAGAAAATTAASSASSTASAAAAPAASSASTGSAMGGLGGSAAETIGEQVGTAITPTFSSTGTGALSNTLGAAAQPLATQAAQAVVAPSLTTVAAPTVAAPTVATPTVAAPQVASQSASFFDQLTEPKTLLGIAQLGGTLMSGAAGAELDNKTTEMYLDQKRYDTDKTYDLGMANVANNARELDMQQQKLNDDQALINRRYNDLNSPGGNRTGVSIDESKLPADTTIPRSVKKANVSKQVADILAPKKKPNGAV